MLARLALVFLVTSSTHALANECKTSEEQAACETACNAKRYDACAKLGLAIINTGDSSMLVKGVTLVDKACTGKSALGCGGLGSLYMGGIGVPRDTARAVKLFEGACAKGDGISCESLGGWYGQLGDPAAPMELSVAMPQAARWYERACKLKRPAACAFVAAMILDGTIAKGDRKRVPGLLDTACRGEVNVACKMLGDRYAKGDLVRRDVKRANALYAKSCKLGFDRACSATAE